MQVCFLYFYCHYHQFILESEGNSGGVETGDSANVDNDYLTKVNTNISPKLELNRVASWLCSHPVFGDAIFSGISCDGFGHMSLQFLYSCLRVSLPSGLWIKDSASKFLFNMPCRFHHPAWTVFSQKLPATLLQEIIVRRCGVVTGYQKEIIPVLTNADENDKNDTNNIGKDGQINENNFDERVYEDVPTNGWWKLGVLRTNNDSNDKINSVKNSSIKTLRPEKIKNKIILPVSVGLFSISGKEFITTSAVVRGSREAANNLQELALQILWEIQKCGEVWLNTVQSKLNFFFFKNLVSENNDKYYGEGKFFTENLKNENDLSSGSDLFYEINNDEITDEIFPMNVVLKELGEGKDENENEGEVENTLNSFVEDGGVVAFTLMITPIYKENNVKNKHIKNEFMNNREMNKEGEKKKIRYCDINVEASDINHNTNDIDNESDISAKKDSIKIQMNNDEIVRIEVSEDRGTSPKKPRLVSANIMPEKLNHKYTHDDKIGSATDKAVEEIEYVMDTVGERREGIENISTNARYANVSTAGNEFKNKPITVCTQNQKKSTVFSESTSRVGVGCTVYTFSALKLMPIDLERMLLKLKVGEEIEVEYCCLQRGLNEFFKTNELNEKLDKKRNNGYFDIARDRVSDQEDNKVINKNESIVADEINEESFIRNQSEAVNAAEIVVMNEIEVYSFKILLMARKRVVNQALRKKIKPDLFYPSLSVQVTYIHHYFCLSVFCDTAGSSYIFYIITIRIP